jgi:hypothetical protein
MRSNPIIAKRLSSLLYLFLLLLNACSFSEIFPLSIKDIDTLTAYRQLQDSLARIPKTLTIFDSITVMPIDTTTIIKQSDHEKVQHETWSITEGAFKIKENAIRKCHSFRIHDIPSFVYFKNQLYYVRVGQFDTEDSVIVFREANKSLLSIDNYISKITMLDSIIIR